MATNTKSHHHDTHAIPPQEVCDAYKQYRQMRDSEIAQDDTIVDLSGTPSARNNIKIRPMEIIGAEKIEAACLDFLNKGESNNIAHVTSVTDVQDCTVYEHSDFPGLKIYPGLLPPSCQTALLSRLLHRDLANPLHKTNLHDEFTIPYPSQQVDVPELKYPSASFFVLPQSSRVHELQPHSQEGDVKPMNIAQFLRKKLRWLTLGAQYDWSTRSYPLPGTFRSSFPEDIRSFVSDLFPRVKAESGVVLVYSPKDYMPVHRDVSEECYRELCSFSLGCDGIFLLALPRGTADVCNARGGQPSRAMYVHKNEDRLLECDQAMNTIAIRVRSGDMLQLSGAARWAWHAMPKVVAGTCPDWLKDWPATAEGHDPENFEHWKGFMEKKRFNISCRQVWDE